MVAALLVFNCFHANSAATAPWTLSLCAVRRKPSNSRPRFVGSVKSGDVPEGDTVAIPAFHKIGTPGRASLEQLEPIAATIVGSAASLVAAACPPSALQPVSWAESLIGWPRSLPPLSS